MSDKSDLFFKSLAAKRAAGGSGAPKKFAEGGPIGASGADAAPPDDGGVSPEEKFAAAEIQSALTDTGPAGAERLAKALKAFWLIVDAQPHDEGGSEPGEGMESFTG
jgi:hypothetical protein